MNVQIHPRFMLLLILTSFFRGEFGPSGGGGARWWSDDGGDSQASLQPGFDLLRRVTVAVQQFPSSSGAGAWREPWLGLIRSSPTQLSSYMM